MEQIWDFQLVKLSNGGALTVSQVVLVLVVLAIGLLVSRILANVLRRHLLATQVSADAAMAVHKLVFYTLVVVVFVTSLKLLGIPITAFAFLSGAIAIGVGFGAQNIINNFISGWILMTERPVRVGDFVEVDDYKGRIEMVGNRSTRIRRVDGVHMLVPNRIMLERTVINWTLMDRDIRTQIRVGVVYGSPVRQVEKLLLQVVAEQPECKGDPAPTVVFEDFGDNALIFDVYFWCEVGAEKDLRRIRSDIRFRIDELFAAAGIVIAFPQRDVHLDTATPLRVQLEKEELPDSP